MEQPARRPFPRWPSFAVLLGAAVYLTARWDSIPPRWIIHWSAGGQPNGWATRSVVGVYGLLALGVLILLVHEVGAAMGPRAASASQRAATLDCVRIIMLGAATMLAVLAIELPLGPRMPVPALLALGVAPLVLAMIVGLTRLASTLRRERARGEKVEGYHALHYANANDRRLWVPKLNGMGWTVNLAHPLGWPVLVLIIAVPIAAVVLSATAR